MRRSSGARCRATELLTIIDRFVEVMVHPESPHGHGSPCASRRSRPRRSTSCTAAGWGGWWIAFPPSSSASEGVGAPPSRRGSRCWRSSARRWCSGSPARPSSARPAGPTSMPPAPQQSGGFSAPTPPRTSRPTTETAPMTLKRLFPEFGFTLDHAPAIVRHMVQFGLAGLAAVATGAEESLMPRYLAALTIVLLLGMVLTRALLMKWRGIKAMRFGAIDKKDFLIPPFAFFYFYIVFAAAFDLPAVSTQVFFHSEVISWVGVVFCLAGLLLLLWSLVSFGQSFRVGIDTVRPDRLVTTGVFAFSRNPIYVAFAIVLIGQFLIFPNWTLLAYLGAATWLFHRQVLREEEYLRSHYGPEYSEYCQRVRRYL